jgi:hypothetical protein
MTERSYKVAVVRHHPKTGQIFSQEVLTYLKPMTHQEAVTFISKQSNYIGRSFMVVEV